MTERTIFEKGKEGRADYYIPIGHETSDIDSVLEDVIPSHLLRKKQLRLPELTEGEVVRHFTRLSQLNYGVDTGFYPLGSCTMKYNPKINEDVANLPGFSHIHPYQPLDSVQGALELMYNLQEILGEIAGMDAVSLQPAAGAHGEFTGLMMIMAYHALRNEHQRTKIIIPDSAHGTNPATAALSGCSIIQVPSNSKGGVDLAKLREATGNDTAALMLTNPSTLGLFEDQIIEISNIIHDKGGLLYYDGANMNAIMGYARPGDMGFDVVHFNLHKTFSAPHGGGGPGSGPVGVKGFLEPFLPKPIITKNSDDGSFALEYQRPSSIGKVKAFYGNFSVMVKAYTYLLMMGGDGLKKVSERAVLNANYLMSLLSKIYGQPFASPCKHEFVITPGIIKERGVHTLDIAKRLMDYGFHPPTVYFPLTVDEALMIEPTETENKETLDSFFQAMKSIALESQENPVLLTEAPHSTPVSRLDETRAARRPVLRWRE